MGNPATSRTPPIGEMMRRLGLDAGACSTGDLGLGFLTAFQRCQECVSKPACRAWLARTPDTMAMAPHFCPNADIFFEMQIGQRKPRRGDWQLTSGALPAET